MTPRAIKALVSGATRERLAGRGSLLKTMPALRSSIAGGWLHRRRDSRCIANPDPHHLHHHRRQRPRHERAGQSEFRRPKLASCVLIATTLPGRGMHIGTAPKPGDEDVTI
jgi:hypothetical protein